MLWEADLQRIANQETDAISQALIDEQEFFRHIRLSSSGSEVLHSVRLVKVRSNSSRILWLFGSQRLSQNVPTIEAFEALPRDRNCIRFEWNRCSRVLQTQRQNLCKRVHKPFTDTLACVYRSGEYSFTSRSLWAGEDCRRFDGPVALERLSH